jgi:hypothetical protein
MVASKPRVLPPGFLSLEEAMDRVDPGVLQDKGTEEERQDFDKFLAVNLSDVLKHLTVPHSIYVEGVRRVRRKTAFQRVSELCAFGRVPSALLLDDFTVRAGVPSKFWLDERFSTEMCSTGRTVVKKPRNEYAISEPTGWVMIDAYAFDAALEVHSTGQTPGQDLQQPVKTLGANSKGRALIHEAIVAVFSLAKEQSVKPPNVIEIIKPVNNWLRKHRHSAAPGNLIQTMAGEERYDDHRGKRGVTVQGRLRPVSDLEI